MGHRNRAAFEPYQGGGGFWRSLFHAEYCRGPLITLLIGLGMVGLVAFLVTRSVQALAVILLFTTIVSGIFGVLGCYYLYRTRERARKKTDPTATTQN